MGKIKYRFNPESLSFDRLRFSLKDLILKILSYFFCRFSHIRYFLSIFFTIFRFSQRTHVKAGE